MANNKSIQFLRGTDEALKNNGNEQLLAGQPLYDKTNNWLCIGNGGKISDRKSISMDFNEDALTPEEIEELWGSGSSGGSSSGGSGSGGASSVPALQPSTKYPESALQMVADGVSDGIDFRGMNPKAEALDPDISTIVPYGAHGLFSASFGGKSYALGKRSFAINTTTIAKGGYSFASGNNCVTLAPNTFVTGLMSTAAASNSAAFGDRNLSNGESSLTLGVNNDADTTATASMVGGVNNVCKSAHSLLFATDSSTTTAATYSVVFGHNNKDVAANTSIIAGSNHSITSGEYMSVFGYGNSVSGNSSSSTTILGANNTVFSGSTSLIVGESNTLMNGSVSCLVAGTLNDLSTSSNCFVAGYDNELGGNKNVYLLGTQLKMNSSSTVAPRIVIGTYNNPSSTATFAVGSGTNANRKNIFEISSDGIVKVWHGNALVGLQTYLNYVKTITRAYETFMLGNTYTNVGDSTKDYIFCGTYKNENSEIDTVYVQWTSIINQKFSLPVYVFRGGVRTKMGEFYSSDGTRLSYRPVSATVHDVIWDMYRIQL